MEDFRQWVQIPFCKDFFPASTEDMIQYLFYKSIANRNERNEWMRWSWTNWMKNFGRCSKRANKQKQKECNAKASLAQAISYAVEKDSKTSVYLFDERLNPFNKNYHYSLKMIGQQPFDLTVSQIVDQIVRTVFSHLRITCVHEPAVDNPWNI